MLINKYFLALSIAVIIVLFSGCSIKNNMDNNQEQNGYLTINGIAKETKDGFYVDEYVLKHNEAQKYDAKYNANQYRDKNLEIVGKKRKVDIECDPYEQCRQESYKIIYDIQSIKIND